jgi:hypothetical protein
MLLTFALQCFYYPLVLKGHLFFLITIGFDFKSKLDSKNCLALVIWKIQRTNGFDHKEWMILIGYFILSAWFENHAHIS